MRRILLIAMVLLVSAGLSVAENPETTTFNGNRAVTGSEAVGQRTVIELDELIWEEDWEQGENGWEFEDALVQEDIYWLTSDYMPNDGLLSWRCFDPDIGANGGYDNHWLQWLATPQIDLTETTSPEVSFYFRLICEEPEDYLEYDGWDAANVWVFYGDGVQEVIEPTTGIEYNITSAFSFGDEWSMGPGIPGWGNEDTENPIASWSEVTIDLSDYIEYDNVRVVWAFCSDPMYCTADDGTGNVLDDVTGFQVDDINVYDGETELFADDAEDPENTQLDMFSGIISDMEQSWFIFVEGPTAPSPTHVLADTMSAIGYTHYWTSPDIDLSEVEIVEGETLELDVMVRGNIQDIVDQDHHWTCKVFSYEDDTWYYATNVNRDGTNYVFVGGPPEEWIWYSEAYNTPWILNEVVGHTIRVRFEFTAAMGGYMVFDGIYFDDVTIQTTGVENDIAVKAMDIPFPNSINYDIPMNVTFINQGMNPLDFAALWSMNGNITPFPGGDMHLDPGEEISVFMDPDPDDGTDYWVPDETGLHTIFARVQTLDDANENNTSDTAYVEVLPEGVYELGYDKHNANYYNPTYFDAGEGPIVHFFLNEDLEPYDVRSVRALWNGDLGGNESVDITVHVYAGGDTPGEELYAGDFVVDQTVVLPEWHNMDLDIVDELQGLTGDFWVWIEILDEGTYPHIVFSTSEPQPGHFYEYDGIDVSLGRADWMLRVINTGHFIDEVSENDVTVIPSEFALGTAYPNPFNPSTTISFDVARMSNVCITAYNLVGQEVARIVDQNVEAGSYSAIWNAEGLASGIYFIRMETDGFSAARKVMLLK